MRGEVNDESVTATNQSYANLAKVAYLGTHGCKNASEGVSRDEPLGTLEGLFPAVNHGHARSRDRNNRFPLEKAQAAYERMMSNSARFRVVLTTGN